MEDDKVDVELELEEYTILQLALEAHKRDITLNKMVELVLMEAIAQHKEQYDTNSETDQKE